MKLTALKTTRIYRSSCAPALSSAPRFPSLASARCARRQHASPATEEHSRSGGPPPPPSSPSAFSSTSSSTLRSITRPGAPPANWDENPNLSISTFSELPSSDFGVNQHIVINQEFKEALRQILWQFRAPIRYAFAYGSGVFPQTSRPSTTAANPVHPRPEAAITTVQGSAGKMIDFIFGVSYSQHWHALNLQQHRDHYSSLGSLGSYAVSRVQDNYGAGVYFHPYVTVNGTLIKYGVVNLDVLGKDLSEWTTLYLAGRLQKPVKILRDDPRVRLANQVNLISAVRTALLLLPENFCERDLYTTIAGISYTGDPRMTVAGENPRKVNNIVDNQLANFRQLYAPLVENLPNVAFRDAACTKPGWAEDPGLNAKLQQDMAPRPRGNIVRRLPKAFRQKMYFAFQSRYQIPRAEFQDMMEDSTDEDSQGIYRREGGPFERRIASEDPTVLREEVRRVIKRTVEWPATVQSVKGFATSGIRRSLRYMREKRAKSKEGKGTKKSESSKKDENGSAGAKKAES